MGQIVIDKSMNLRDLIGQYPEAANVFAAYGIGCLGCAMAHFETIEQGITAHGINIDDFMKDLNALINENAG
jgi:hybrid cluster-associated redox disulfide protein